jgi:hypothetical protein
MGCSRSICDRPKELAQIPMFPRIKRNMLEHDGIKAIARSLHRIDMYETCWEIDVERPLSVLHINFPTALWLILLKPQRKANER